MGKGARGRGGASIPRKRPADAAKNGDAAKQTKLEALVIKVPFPNEKAAGIAKNSLSADAAPKNARVTTQISVEGSTVTCSLSSESLRSLRSGATSYFENLILIINTPIEFDETHENTPDEESAADHANQTHS